MVGEHNKPPAAAAERALRVVVVALDGVGYAPRADDGGMFSTVSTVVMAT